MSKKPPQNRETPSGEYSENPGMMNAEVLLDAILEQSPHSMWISDSNGTLIRMNQACRNLLHVTDVEAVGKYNIFGDNIIEEQGFMPLVRQAYEECRKVRFSIRYDTSRLLATKLKDTTAPFLEVTISPVLDSQNRLVHAVIQHTDITERKQAEKEYREREQFLRQVINNAPFGAHFYQLKEDGSLILTSSNKAADQILKTDHDVLHGRTIEDAFPGLVSTKIPFIYKEIARNGGEYTQGQEDYNTAEIRGVFEANAFQTMPGHMAVFFTDITNRKRTEAALTEEATRRRILFEQSPDGVLIIDPQTMRFLDFNTAAHQQLGYTREEFASLSIGDVEAMESLEETRARIAQVIREGQADFETLHRTRQGELRNVSVKARTIDVLGKSYYQCIWRDITEHKAAEEERKTLQAQLAQSQKMESVGRLAGGVAHDFNNMLGVIIGHAELALDQTAPDHTLHSNLDEIRKAAQRSADLTHQLLAFARKQTAAPRLLNLNDAITGTLKMLRRLIGEDINLIWRPEPDLRPVRIDPAQLDQILANLCVNARDAIKGVGQISIETRCETVSEHDHFDHADVVPGEYVVLALSDNGCGMAPEILEHIFEPFFTTKDIGRGTGLGLATVYGIVKQNDGFIAVTSKHGKGTRFKIYLPPAMDKSEEMAGARKTELWQSAGELVLLVEDEPSILSMGQIILQKIGFNVAVAGTPSEAIRQAKEHHGNLDLLITDVVMPEMNGRDLAAQIKALNPGIRCLYMSGYTADVIAHRGVLDEGVDFIQKPFTVEQLSTKVREILERK
jgi:two-component system, cell cycle sensor histidine kinase and response regulator CckA